MSQQVYHVTWEIGGICAGSPREAAEIALAIQQDPRSTAQLFLVAPGDHDYMSNPADPDSIVAVNLLSPER